MPVSLYLETLPSGCKRWFWKYPPVSLRLILLLLGMVLNFSSILLIMIPVTAPIFAGLDFNLIHFAIVTVIAVVWSVCSHAVWYLDIHGQIRPERSQCVSGEHLRLHAALCRSNAGGSAAYCRFLDHGNGVDLSESESSRISWRPVG